MNEPLIADIHSLSHEGRGIANIEGKTVFIENALPNETVLFTYQKRHKRFDEGKTVKVLKAAKTRISPKCPHFEKCGGCSLQHMDPNAQLQFKQNIVLEHLKHFGGGVQPLQILPPLVGPFFGYRRRARLGVRYVAKKNDVLVGFREKGNRYIADLHQCEILHPPVGNMLIQLKQLLSSLQGSLDIPQIEVAVGDEEVALVFRHLNPLSEADKKALWLFAKEHKIAIYLQSEGPESILLLSSPTGKSNLYYKLHEFNIDIKFQPTDFTQINAEINHQMIKRVIELLDLKAPDHVLDLFCGLGNFTLPIARQVAQVVGVEGSEEIIKRAYQNAEFNKLNNVEFYVNNLQVNKIKNVWTEKPYDKVLLDPPRTGAKEIIPLISRLVKSRIVYVSCNPATFARDIGEWVNKYHFKLDSVGVFDMFPHTTHIESVAVLSR